MARGSASSRQLVRQVDVPLREIWHSPDREPPLLRNWRYRSVGLWNREGADRRKHQSRFRFWDGRIFSGAPGMHLTRAVCLLPRWGSPFTICSPFSTRRRERIMRRLKSPRRVQMFLSIHDQVANLCHLPRDKLSAIDYRAARTKAFVTWAEIATAPFVT